eukprot:365558-Chlamydomonas_euryale.AAC.14
MATSVTAAMWLDGEPRKEEKEEEEEDEVWEDALEVFPEDLEGEQGSPVSARRCAHARLSARVHAHPYIVSGIVLPSSACLQQVRSSMLVHACLQTPWNGRCTGE